MIKKQLLLIFFMVFMAFFCLANGYSDVIKLISFYTECKIEDAYGNGIEGIQVSLYYVDFDSGTQRLYFQGISNTEGLYDFTSQMDTNDLPENYAYKLVLQTEDQRQERIIDGQPELFSLLNQLKTIVLSGNRNEKTLILDDDWDVGLSNFEQKTKLAILTAGFKDTEVKKVLKYFIQTKPEKARIYINGEYIGTSPMELTLPVVNDEEIYIITIEKDGFETEVLIMDVNKTLSFPDDLILYKKEIVLKQLD